MNASASYTRASAMHVLYAPSPAELEANLRAGAARVPDLCHQIRPDESGAADRCERLAGQLDCLRLQALRLGAALRDAR